MQTQRTDLWTRAGEGSRQKKWDERRAQHGTIYTTICKQIAMGICCDSRNSNLGSVTAQRYRIGWDMEGGFKKEVIFVYLWLTHIIVWQKPTQYCKAIIVQLKTTTKIPLSPNTVIMVAGVVRAILYEFGSFLIQSINVINNKLIRSSQKRKKCRIYNLKSTSHDSRLPSLLLFTILSVPYTSWH